MAPFRKINWSLLATISMVKQASRSKMPFTRTMEVFIAASTLPTFPPWKDAYSPVHARAKRYVLNWAPLSTRFAAEMGLRPMVWTSLPAGWAWLTVGLTFLLS